MKQLGIFLGACAITWGALAIAQTVYAPSANIMKVTLSTVAALPTCNAGNEGLLVGISDALAPTSLAAIVGGGAVHLIAYCNGTAWIVL